MVGRILLGLLLVLALLVGVSLLGAEPSQAQTATATATVPPAGGTPSPTPAPMMGTPSMSGATATPDARVSGQLIETLRRGGHVIFMRHGITDRAQQDTDPANLANCATQRNLTEEGRAQARAIGEGIRTLGIPVGQVLASEYCRALEHARLAFGRAQAEPSLVLLDPLPAEVRQRNTAALRQLLAARPAAGTNTVMVSHSPNLREALGVDLTVEGSAAIIRLEQGTPQVVGVVLPGAWTTLAGTTPAANPMPAEMPRSGGGGAAVLGGSAVALLVGFGGLVGLGAWRRRGQRS